MKTIKKFWIYFLLFIGLFLFVGFFKELGLKKEEEKYFSNYKILKSSPVIMVKETGVSSRGGFLKGYVLNETGEHIKDKFIQFDFYDEYGDYLGTKSKEIKYFNVNEKINFDISFDYRDVNEITIDFVDEVIEQKVEKKSILKDIRSDDATMRIAVPIAVTMLAIYGLTFIQ